MRDKFVKANGLTKVVVGACLQACDSSLTASLAVSDGIGDALLVQPATEVEAIEAGNIQPDVKSPA